ncbi:MAG: hypothetical protein A2297_03145 [Elusimicrobia bacterium RIFOXYB2_FULL_48_7]|nr:MAG: hypothetical protein A2297_03145 [Elusimicrobia bacterium RIFOXYB2_FULL_48_7]
MKSTLARIIFILLAVTLIAALFYNYSIPNREVIVTIPQGSSGKTIADTLYDNRLITNKGLFMFFSNLNGSAKKFQSGTYKLNQKMDMFKIMDLLRKGRIYSIKTTIPEGFTAEQVAALLEQKGLANSGKFLEIVKKQNLEGYLFPETYFIPFGSKEQAIVNIMTGEFRKKFATDMEDQAKKQKMNTRSAVILASIIEKETVLPEERALVSGIFQNRLKKGWMLESCSTVRYAKKKFAGKLTYKDIKFDSPYNTYRHQGLPPGPICNPGIASIEAALNPAQTDLMFFFSEGDGTHEFSKYYKQHIEKQKTLKKKQ